jgi:hypothetical protein
VQAVIGTPGAVLGGLVVVEGMGPAVAAAGAAIGAGRLLPACGGGVRRVRSRWRRARASRARRRASSCWAAGLAPPTSQHTNLPPLVEGPVVRLAGRHAKTRRAGYQRRHRR